MMELPLFPLNLVLFPGMPLNLHIFEERYKLMVNECIDQRSPFGVVLISNDQPDTSQIAKPHMIGCTAHITQVKPLAEGRMRIAAVGRSRFQVSSLKYDRPYLSGIAEEFPLVAGDTETAFRQARLLKGHLRSYIQALQESKQLEFSPPQLPSDPTTLAYLAAVLLNSEPEEKQELLAFERLDHLLQSLLSTYRRESALIRVLTSPPDGQTFDGNFSLN